jgi:DNA-binding beta-propeller fold protein YncE
MKQGFCAAFVLAMTFNLTQAQSLYWLESTLASPALKKSALDGSGVQTLNLAPGSLPQGVAHDARGDSVYWVELAFTGAHINVATSSLSAPRAVMGNGSVLRDIAVDTAARKLYWTATNLQLGSRIFRANIDGTGVDTLLAWSPGGAETPRGIALDVAEGKMYWTDFNTGKILRANVSGTALEDILDSLDGPVALRLDLVNGRMYWTEANTKALRRANLDGTSVELLVSTTGTPNYLALDIDDGRMYWTEIGTPVIRRADLDGQNAQDLPLSVNNPAGIMVVRPPSTGVISTHPVLPREYALMQNFPNPFNPSTTIRYDLPFAGDVSLKVYDFLGREVAVLETGRADAGRYSVTWNAEDVASGVYFYKIRSGTYHQVRRMMLVK